MMVFEGIAQGWNLFSNSVKVLLKRPILAFPLLMAWTIISAMVLYLRYYYQFPSSIQLILLNVFIIIFVASFIICLGALIMLELVQQIERDGKVSLARAAGEAFSTGALKVIPIAFIWAVVWFILTLISALTSKKDRGKGNASAEDAARTLAGAGSPFTWWRLGVDMFNKLVRMYVFLSLPAIAWEDKGPFKALKRSFSILTKHPIEFMSAYTLTAFAAWLMAIPTAIVFYMDDSGMSITPIVWTIVMIYIGLVWSASIYLEQMTTGLLYQWHMRWTGAGSKGSLSSVQAPSIMEDVRFR
jgi:hypothetical protein